LGTRTSFSDSTVHWGSRDSVVSDSWCVDENAVAREKELGDKYLESVLVIGHAAAILIVFGSSCRKYPNC
jgi:hypothetical protein